MRLEIEDCYECEVGHTVTEKPATAMGVAGASSGFLGCPKCQEAGSERYETIFVEEAFRFRITG